DPIENVGTYRDKRVFLRTGAGPWFDFFDGLEDHPDIWSTLQAKLEQIGADIIENAVHPNLGRFSGAPGEGGVIHDVEIAHGPAPGTDAGRLHRGLIPDAGSGLWCRASVTGRRLAGPPGGALLSGV